MDAADYREQALKLFPWLCGRCGREFNGKNLRELTVHHKDHDHRNNPSDGSNWELLCIVSSGGVFDSAEPVVGPPVQDGTLEVRFSGCNAGVIRYDIPSIGRSGDVPIERIVLDNVALCESLGQ